MVAKKKNASTTKNKATAVKCSAQSITVNHKEFLMQCVNHITSKIVDAKPHDGRTPRGVAEKLLQEGRSVFPTMTMNMINYAIKKIKVEGKKTELKKSTLKIGPQTCVSSLTEDSTVTNTNADCDAVGAFLTLKSSSQSGESSTNQSSADIPINDASGDPSNSTMTLSNFLKGVMNPPQAKIIGRPKGSTSAEAKSVAARVELATKEATEELEEINKSKSAKKRSNKGLLDAIIGKAKLNHGVDEEIVILKDTIRKRLKRGSTNGHVGQSIPMAEVEPYLVQLIIQLANMRTPITAAQGLELANSLISGTDVENEIMDWKSNNCHANKLASVSGYENKKLIRQYTR
jgi:hypothetical protein